MGQNGIAVAFFFVLLVTCEGAVKWQKLQQTGTVPSARYGVGMISNGTKIFLFGGCNSGYDATDDNMYELDVETSVRKQ